MQLSNAESNNFNHEYFDTPHLLLGLLKEGDGIAFHVLNNLGIGLREARTKVAELELLEREVDEPAFGKSRVTPSLMKVYGYTFDEARELNQKYVGTEHLLLALLRETDGAVAQVLEYFGHKSADVRQVVLNLLGHGLS